MAGPSKSNPTPHRELGFNTDRTGILDLANKEPNPFQKLQDSEMPDPQPF